MKPQRFRKKPVEVEAMLFTEDDEKREEIINWVRGHGGDIMIYGPDLRIQTNIDSQRARPGDWIIRGVEGEFYPCPASVFDATYEAVTTPF